jgi:hypothetical protein
MVVYQPIAVHSSNWGVSIRHSMPATLQGRDLPRLCILGEKRGESKGALVKINFISQPLPICRLRG